MTKKKKVHGVGVNDADYVVQIKNIWECPFYRTWRSMLSRCYSAFSLRIKPTYTDCLVATEWHVFSVFREWMVNQDYEGNHLDKDILIPCNKVYSPEFCIFVSGALNKFLTAHRSNIGKWPTGVSWNNRTKKFYAQCHNPFTGKRDNLGYFSDPDEAYEAWRSAKHEHACRYADMQKDPRIANALQKRYAEPSQLNEVIGS